MRNLIAFLFLMIFFWFALLETDTPDTPETEWSNIKPDSLREPDHFDWDHNRYVYKDEIKPDTILYDWGPITAMPDYMVRMEGGYRPPKPKLINTKSLGGMGNRLREASDLPELKINGKYYRQRLRADGVIQLIPIR